MKVTKSIHRFLLIAASIMFLHACNVEDSETEIELGDNFEVVVGSRVMIDVDTTISDSRLVWSSDNEEVISISQTGEVVAVSEGSATVTVVDQETNVSDSVEVTVVAQIVLLTEIGLGEAKIFAVGDNYQLPISILPTDSTDQSLVFTSSDDSILSVSDIGLISALAEGEATITALNEATNISASITFTVEPKIVLATSISIGSDVSISMGESIQLAPAILPTSATDQSIVFATDNSSIVTVSDTGMITSVGLGAANVTATNNASGLSAKIVVSVIENVVLVTSLQVESTVNMTRGEEYQIEVITLPANATDPSLLFESSDETVLTVSSSGLISTTGAGQAFVQVTNAASQLSEQIEVRVSELTISLNSISLGEDVSLIEGATWQLQPTLLPADATDNVVIFSSDDPGIATVGITGAISAVSSGSAVIIASSMDSLVSDSIIVTVTPAEVFVTSIELGDDFTLSTGDTHQLTPTILPADAEDKTVTYESSDTGIVTVDVNGEVTAVAVGGATVTATNVNSGVTDSLYITVEAPEYEVTLVELDFDYNSLGNWGAYFGLTDTVTVSADAAKDSDYGLHWLSDDSNVTGLVLQAVDTPQDFGQGGDSKFRLTYDIKFNSYAGAKARRLNIFPDGYWNERISKWHDTGAIGEWQTVTVDFDEASFSADGKIVLLTENDSKDIDAYVDNIKIVEIVDVEPVDDSVVSADFEDGSLGDWEHYWETPEGASAVSVIADAARTSDYGVHLVSDGTNHAGITLPADATPQNFGGGQNRRFKLTYDVKANNWDGSARPLRFYFVANGAWDDRIEKWHAPLSSGDWTQVEVTFDEADITSYDNDGRIDIYFIGENGDVDAYIDNIKVVDVSDEIVLVESINLGDDLVLTEGDTHTLSADVLPAGAEFSDLVYSSSDETIATVDSDGLITALVPGDVIITGSNEGSGLSDSVAVTINAAEVLVSSIDLGGDLSLVEGDTTQLSATVLPADADNQALIYSSTDDSVVSVGVTGLVSAVSAGSASITVENPNSGVTDTVIVAVAAAEVLVTSVTISDDMGVVEGESQQMVVTVLPVDADDMSLSYVSANEAIATVSASGLVTGVSEGSTTVTVTNARSGLSDSASVTVTATAVTVTSVELGGDITVAAGDSNVISATILPADATDKSLTYSTSNSAIATVSSAGLVTGIAEGSVTITGTNIASGLSDTLVVTVERAEIFVSSVDLGSDVSIAEGATSQLSATILPADADEQTLSYASSNNAIATVSGSGLISGVAKGSVTITATNINSGQSDSITVEVFKLVTSIDLGTDFSLDEGATSQLNASVLPADANDKTLSYSSSDESIATVSDSGLVTAVAQGSATITATNTESGISDSTDVMVTINVSSIDLEADVGAEVGDTHQLSATVLPVEADDKTLSYSSSDDSIATVSDSGLITAIAVGSVTITATNTDSGISDTLEFTVTAAEIFVTSIDLGDDFTLSTGGTQQLSATVLPADADDQSLTYESSDMGIVTVDANGEVTAVAVGAATVTATNAVSGQSDSVYITVEAAVYEVVLLEEDFESNSLGNFASFYGYAGVLTVSGDAANGGSYGVHWSDSGDRENGFVLQSAHTPQEIGQGDTGTFRLTYDIKVNSGDNVNNRYLRLYPDGFWAEGIHQWHNDGTIGEWSTVTIDFDGNDWSADGKLTLTTENGHHVIDAYIDNIKIVQLLDEAPEPAALDSDFESGSVGDWVVYGASASIGVSADAAKDGSYGLHLTSTGTGNAGIKLGSDVAPQDLGEGLSRTFKFSFDVKLNSFVSGKQSTQFNFWSNGQWADRVKKWDEPITSSEWTSIEWTLTEADFTSFADPGQLELYLINATDVDAYFDNIKLEVVE